MKRCPECRRDYYDDTLSYCLDDGSGLLEGPATLEPNTEILPAIAVAENAETRPLIESSERPDLETQQPRRGMIALVLAVAAGAVLIAGGLGVYWYGVVRLPRGDHFQNVKISRATNEGNVESATISPDGKYIAYVTVDGASFALWTKHLATNSRVQIAARGDAIDLAAAAFSPDGNYVYYEVQEQQNSNADLYQIPVLGGPGKKLLSNIAADDAASAISFDPKGRRIAFERSDASGNVISICTANADGTDEHKLIERTSPEAIWGASWSPDGETIATRYFDGKGGVQIALVNVADGTLKPLKSRNFNFITAVTWLDDGSGLLLAAQEQASEAVKIWYLPYPTGDVRLITNDLNRYRQTTLAATKDGSSVIALEEQKTSSIYVSQSSNLGSGQRVSTRTGANDGVWGLSWDRSGRLFSVSQDENKSETWMIDALGSAKMTMENAAVDSLNVTHDGRYLVFASRGSGSWQIWRTDINGGDPRQLTNETSIALYPGLGISPDDRWVFCSGSDGNVRRISIDGSGSSVFIEAPNSEYPQMSPDGTLIAFKTWGSQDRQIKIFSVEGDSAKLLRSINMPRTFVFAYHWSADSRSIIYSDTIGRTSNLWAIPIAGGKANQLTDFKTEIINNFAFSQDGKRLALARGPFTSDAVLISESK